MSDDWKRNHDMIVGAMNMTMDKKRYAAFLLMITARELFAGAKDVTPEIDCYGDGTVKLRVTIPERIYERVPEDGNAEQEMMLAEYEMTAMATALSGKLKS